MPKDTRKRTEQVSSNPTLLLLLSQGENVEQQDWAAPGQEQSHEGIG